MNGKQYSHRVGSASAPHRIRIGSMDENPPIESARSQPADPALDPKGGLPAQYTCTECIGDR